MTTSATLAITPQTLRSHGLTTDEYDRIKSLLGGREPSLTELGIFGVMWSEHCSYKSSRVHLKRLPTHSRRVLQGPGENAGIIDIGDGWACAFKIESHNHPSFIEPFQGATTGVGGILRDIFTMGARPVAVMDSLRFGPIEKSKASDRSVRPTQAEVTQTDIRRNHSILEGVVSGIASYGNCFGVPNVGGETKFEPCYSGNPLVNAFALGLVRQDQVFYAKASGEGNPVIYVGAKTGRDGIHGATMASEEFSEESEAKRPNVQVGDPFLEKLLLEACLEAMQTGAIIGIQDMGAAGLTCSTCEMGARGGVGIEIEMDRVPQRETGMSAYEILLSESQERMLLVAQKGREEEVYRVFRKWGLDAVEVGRVISEPRMRVIEHGEETNTVEGPGAGDGGVIRVKGSQRALSMALDGNSRWCYLDPKLGAMHAVAEAARNVACSGATPVGATNCLNFGNPEKPHIMWQFSQTIDGITKACEELEIPITGGNVSFYNETLGEGIYPTPVLGVVGILEDVNKAMFPHFREAGCAVVLLCGSDPGDATDAEVEFGSSEYAKEILGELWGFPPALELEREAALQKATVELIAEGLLESAHDCSEGGLAVALAEASFSAGIGCNVELARLELPVECVLFGEDASRIVISCDRSRLARIKEVAAKHGVSADALGETVLGTIEIKVDGQVAVSAKIAELRDEFEGALERALRSEPVAVAAD